MESWGSQVPPAPFRTVQRGSQDPERVGSLLRVQQSPDSCPQNVKLPQGLVMLLSVQGPRKHPTLISSSLSRSTTGTRPIHLRWGRGIFLWVLGLVSLPYLSLFLSPSFSRLSVFTSLAFSFFISWFGSLTLSVSISLCPCLSVGLCLSIWSLSVSLILSPFTS